MQVEIHSVVAMAGMLASMTTPKFSLMVPHCLTFDYEVKAPGNMPILEIHIRMTDYMLSGKRIWTSQYHNLRRSKAHITLLAVNSSGDLPYVLDFVGTVAEPTSTLIRVANVEFLNGQCEHEQTVATPDEDSGTTVFFLTI